ncbi:hypothetical protein I2I05_10240 [Hymenobacter sp. BT683]|uniref:DUF4377 domain-containing protein n=1 Tax=Hymenobacter jeongseonensis TaxID=2791027 RepID=A0ABS0IIN3_9BACT|nr:hypothetical protein [Hymenobacter jeongseonensis]MBF9237773.1 hypothetical protein [Hymenobacter jeongseonensis]
MRLFTSLYALTCIGLATGVLLTGCAAQDSTEPEPCTTTATVQLCYGMTAVCRTEHTTLKLANGTILHPSGKVWEAYLPNQVDKQILRISYAILPRITNDAPGYENATLSCLESNQPRCGNE